MPRFRCSLLFSILLLSHPAGLVAQSVEEPQWVAPDSVALQLLAEVRGQDSTILVELRYATKNNFTGAALPGYLGNRFLLRREAAEGQLGRRPDAGQGVAEPVGDRGRHLAQRGQLLGLDELGLGVPQGVDLVTKLLLRAPEPLRHPHERPG